MFNHLFPATTVVDNEDTAAGHGFKSDAGPIFRGVHGLKDDVTVFVEVLLGDDAVVFGEFDPGLGFADFFGTFFSETKKEAVFWFGGDEVLINMQCIAGVFFLILPRDAPASEVVVTSLRHKREVFGVEVGLEGEEVDRGVGVDGFEE